MEPGIKQKSEDGNEQCLEDSLPFCDAENHIFVFCLRKGKWAGEIWGARLKCCENPLCDCANVDFYCCRVEVANGVVVRAEDEGTPAPVLFFSLNPFERRIVPQSDRSRRHESDGLAKGLVAEMTEKEWSELSNYILMHKRNAVQEMDVNSLAEIPPPDNFTVDGEMAPYAQIFPFADTLQFDFDDDNWFADDHYCVTPDCDCHDVSLHFLRVRAGSDGIPKGLKAIGSAAYDYELGTTKVRHEPADGKPLIGDLVDAMLAAHPSYRDDAKRRHGQLRALYARSVREAKQHVETAGIPIKRAEPKVGRNQPCPCGSGKKYKKCCGMK